MLIKGNIVLLGRQESSFRFLGNLIEMKDHMVKFFAENPGRMESRQRL